MVKLIKCLLLLSLLFTFGCDVSRQIEVATLTPEAKVPGYQINSRDAKTEIADIQTDPTVTSTPISTDPDLSFVSTAIPTSTPRFVSDDVVNLKPMPISTGMASLGISNVPGVYGMSEINIDYEVYISWAVVNEGEDDLTNPFVVDLYLDNILIERWQSEGLNANEYIMVTDWIGLHDYLRLKIGNHKLSLRVDSTDLISETNELDNTAAEDFYFSSDSQLGMAEFKMDRFPDLAPYIPDGWGSALIATSYSGDVFDGPLSTSVPTYMKFGIQNQGTVSIDQSFWVSIFLDGVLVSRRLVEDILSGESIKSDEVSILMDIMTVSPGTHTLRLEIDSTDRVLESDEGNNVLEKEFTWSLGPVESRRLVDEEGSSVDALPTPVELPNLRPGWRMHWDGPVVLSLGQDSYTDDLIIQDDTLFVDLAIHNNSTVPVYTPFSIGLYLDNGLVNVFEVPDGIGPNEFLWFEDWEIDLSRDRIALGIHDVKIVLDMNGYVTEFNEDDNTFSKEFFVYNDRIDEKSYVKYSENELNVMLSSLTDILYTGSVNSSTIDSDSLTKVLDIVDAGYYLLTGTSIDDERLTNAVLSREDFDLKIDQMYFDRFASSPASKYSEILSERESLKSKGTGLKTDFKGKATILVNGEQSPIKVIGILAHELGHFRQGVINPGHSVVNDFNMDAIQEAQAQQFERAFWLKLEEFSNTTFISYPNYKGFRDFTEDRLKIWEEGKHRDPHIMGALLQWLIVLDDPNLGHLSSVLLKEGMLGSRDCMLLFEYLVELPLVDGHPSRAMEDSLDTVEKYVSKRIESLGDKIDVILENVKNRLHNNSNTQDEGPSDLRIIGLLMP